MITIRGGNLCHVSDSCRVRAMSIFFFPNPSTTRDMKTTSNRDTNMTRTYNGLTRHEPNLTRDMKLTYDTKVNRKTKLIHDTKLTRDTKLNRNWHKFDMKFGFKPGHIWVGPEIDTNLARNWHDIWPKIDTKKTGRVWILRVQPEHD